MTSDVINVYNVVYFVLYAVEGIFFWRYCFSVFQSRDKRYEIAVTEIFYILMAGVIGEVPFEQSIFYFTVMNFLCIYILYKVKWHTALLHALLTAVAMLLGELLVFFATMQSVPEQILEAPLYNFLVNDILSRVLYLVFLYIRMRFVRNISEKKQSIDKASVFMLIVPVISISLIPVLVVVLVHAAPKPTFGLIVSLCMIFLTVLNLIVLCVCNYILKKKNEFISLQMQVQKEQDLTEYYKMLLEQNENQRILIHDMKKHLQSIQLLHEQGDASKALDYIELLVQSPALADSVRVSDNTLLNAIVNRYWKVCRENGIAFHTDIRKETVNFLSEQDLTALFGNLLDNAIEAVLTQKRLGQKELFMELNVECRNSGGFVMVSMENSCVAKPVSLENGRLLSTKKDQQRHGLGMKSIERVVNACHGKMQTYYNEEKNTFRIVILLKD